MCFGKFSVKTNVENWESSSLADRLRQVLRGILKSGTAIWEEHIQSKYKFIILYFIIMTNSTNSKHSPVNLLPVDIRKIGRRPNFVISHQLFNSAVKHKRDRARCEERMRRLLPTNETPKVRILARHMGGTWLRE